MPEKSRSTKRGRFRTVRLLLAAGSVLLLAAAGAGSGLHPSLSILGEAFARGRTLAAELRRAAAGLVEKAPAYVLDQPYFAVEEIKVFGAKRADRAEIIAGAGLRRGLSIWRIDPRQLEQKLRRHPWIKRALVRRELPRRVVVRVEEWSPAGIVALEGLYYVDPEGVVFKAVEEADSVDLPLVTGLRAAGLSPTDGSTRDKLAEVLALAHVVERSDMRLSEIRFVPEGEIVLYPASARVPFAMGWGDWADKVARLQRFLAEWHGQEAHFAGVDMSFAGQAVVRLRRTL